jgi:hypothetical protein
MNPAGPLLDQPRFRDDIICPKSGEKIPLGYITAKD